MDLGRRQSKQHVCFSVNSRRYWFVNTCSKCSSRLSLDCCSYSKGNYIADARPRKNALANDAMGGGSESSAHYFQSENNQLSGPIPEEIDNLKKLQTLDLSVGAGRDCCACNPKITHRDMKAATILLDSAYEAVVGDFRLAKLLDKRESHMMTTMRGTTFYIAPEDLSTGQSLDKTDVFGFGTLLLELITGHKQPLGAPKGMTLEMVKRLYEEKKVEMVADRDLRGCYEAKEMERVVEVALI